MQRGASQHDQRAFGRRQSRIHAFVRISSRSPEPCVVKNFSEGGALLSFASSIVLPDRFRLEIESKGLDVMCEVRRRNGLEFGVQFVQEQADIATRLEDEVLVQPEVAPEPELASSAPRLLGQGGLVTVVPGHEVRDQLFV